MNTLNLYSRIATKTRNGSKILGLIAALLTISVSAIAIPDIEVPTVAITAVDITKLSGVNTYRFVYTIAASDDVGVTDIEIHGAVAGGNFDPWIPGYSQDYPIEIILVCTEFQFEVRAKDAAGNYSVPAGHHFIAESALNGGNHAELKKLKKKYKSAKKKGKIAAAKRLKKKIKSI